MAFLLVGLIELVKNAASVYGMPFTCRKILLGQGCYQLLQGTPVGELHWQYLVEARISGVTGKPIQLHPRR